AGSDARPPAARAGAQALAGAAGRHLRARREPLVTAKRELVEEAGLGGGEWRLAASFFTTPGFCDELVCVYIAERVEQRERAPQADEEIELVRVPVAELASLLPQIEDAKTLSGLLLYLRGR